MDAFEAARARHAKNLERRSRNVPEATEEKVSESPKVKFSNTADVSIEVTVGGVVYANNFRIPNMIGSIHGFTAAKLQKMLSDALRSQFGRIEDVNDVH